MAYVPNQACFAAAKAAASGVKGSNLSEQEILDAFKRVAEHKERLERSGQMTGQAERLRKFAAEEAQRTKIAAAMQRRHAALNVIIRDKLDETIAGLLAAGLTPKRAMLAIVEGTQMGVRNGRKSINAFRQAYENRYRGSMLAEIQREKPHLVHTMHDPKLDADILTEMMELRPGGKPGKTGNSDAAFLAKTFAKHAEMARLDLNKLGASIGKLEGWAGVQMHDDVKMLKVSPDVWAARTLARLDVERTFPEGVTDREALGILEGVYATIITGFDEGVSPAERGQRTSPANMAKALGKHRVLHFKDAAATLAYREEFGYSNTVGGMFSHLRNAARVASNMEVLGPNPEVMFAAIAKSLQRKVKESNLPPKDKAKQVRELQTQAGVLRVAFDIATGASARPESVTMANIGADIRALQSMAKLGGAVISAFADTISAASASQFRGSGFFPGLARQLGGIMQGRPKSEQAEIGFLIGEGFDGLLGRIVHPAAVVDGPVGATARMQELYFRISGLTWWTDVNRGVAGRVIAAEMGMRAQKAYKDLPPRYRHVLEMQGIDEVRWDIIRQAQMRNVNGAAYITPDRIRALPDTAFVPLVADRLATAKGNQARIDSIIADARRDMELSVLRFFADETGYGVITTDAKSQRYMHLNTGLRAGTAAGEVLRFVGQFKGFPIAFTERVLGRALKGHRKDAGAGEKFAHMGALLAGMTLAGYASMTAKDFLKGYWPPRDPGDYRTWLAAAMQGGAFGIYADFLFSQNNRFGGGLSETLLGPTIGSTLDLVEIGMDARDAALSGGEDEFGSARAFSNIWSNAPGANLFFIKPALDFLWINNLREILSPGFLRRQERRRKTEYDQERLYPATPGR